MDDVRRAVNTGVDGVNMYMATSHILREHSHGKGIEVGWLKPVLTNFNVTRWREISN